MTTSRLVAVALDALDARRVAQFWAQILGREISEDPRGALLPGTHTQVGLRIVSSTAPGQGPNRLHLHLTSTTPADQDATVARALSLGASHLDVGQLPEEGHVVLADPGGNELCVIPPGSSFLAGCGFLGEVACDGTRDVGVFWADALAWSLVWDHDQETAIQSPLGGTKIAWGGPPLDPKHGRNRQRFELEAPRADLEAEVARLVGLGARRLSAHPDGSIELADPDGNEFIVAPV